MTESDESKKRVIAEAYRRNDTDPIRSHYIRPGQQFERLTVIGPSEWDYFEHNGKQVSRRNWVCACQCGNVVRASTSALRKGEAKSCGCWLKDFLSKRNKIAPPKANPRNDPTLPGEHWKPLDIAPDYHVSNLGRVRNPSGRIQRTKKAARINNVNLALTKIVARHFLEGYDESIHSVQHIDGDQTNNQAANLNFVRRGEAVKAGKRKAKQEREAEASARQLAGIFKKYATTHVPLQGIKNPRSKE